MTERQYLPTLADLIDRLSIVLMKRIFIGGDSYIVESNAIQHDIDIVLKAPLTANDIYCVLLIMLANRYIWENESVVREGSYYGDKAYTGDLLRATHSINGVRNTAKNVIAIGQGERTDRKIDCLAADLPPEFGNWNVL